MRTLQTQVRLRRLLRVQAEYERRLVEEAGGRQLAEAASGRLLQLLRDVRASWAQESAGLELPGLRGHVTRSLATMEAAAAGLARPGADVGSLGERFREVGLPLVFFLRGMEDADEAALIELGGSGRPALQRSA